MAVPNFRRRLPFFGTLGVITKPIRAVIALSTVVRAAGHKPANRQCSKVPNSDLCLEQPVATTEWELATPDPLLEFHPRSGNKACSHYRVEAGNFSGERWSGNQKRNADSSKICHVCAVGNFACVFSVMEDHKW